MSSKLIDKFLAMEENEAIKTAAEMLKQGMDPMDVLAESRKALVEVGTRYEQGQFFLPEMIVASEIMKAIVEEAQPYLKGDESDEKLGKIVIGSVEGDIHDIGKNIVVFMLEAYGFEVLDMGVDVKASDFVEKVKEVQADILGLSGLLTAVFDNMKEVVDECEAAGLRDKLKIMVGGCYMQDNVVEFIGADAYGRDAQEAVNISLKWVNS